MANKVIVHIPNSTTQSLVLAGKLLSKIELNLSAAITQALSAGGGVLIINLHSSDRMLNEKDINNIIPLPDFCIGINDYHTPRKVYKLAIIGLKMLGYTVKSTTDYRGSTLPSQYYKKDKQVCSIMIGVNGALCNNPRTNQKSEKCKKVISDIQKVFDFIGNNL